MHGHDNISIRMLKIYFGSICKPLEMTFNQALATGYFLLNGKKKKWRKKWQEKYQKLLFSLFNFCCSKTFGKLIFNVIFSLFLGNKFTWPKQSGFKPGDSCIYQLLWIILGIYKSLDDGLEIRSVSLTFLRLSVKSDTR